MTSDFDDWKRACRALAGVLDAFETVADGPNWRLGIEAVVNTLVRLDGHSGEAVEQWWQRPRDLLAAKSPAAVLAEAEHIDDPRVKVVIQLAAGLGCG
jgi:hypothetical protein